MYAMCWLKRAFFKNIFPARSRPPNWSALMQLVKPQTNESIIEVSLLTKSIALDLITFIASKFVCLIV